MGNIVLRKNRVTANTLIGKVGELTINTTDKTLYIHDGSTAGGFSLFRYNTSSAITSGEVPFSNGTQGVLQTSSNLKWTSPNLLINTYKAFHSGNLVQGTAISITESPTNTFTVANTGVTSNVAGGGINVSGATGAVTITNSDRGSSQNIFKTINVVDDLNVAVTNSPITASSNSSSLTFKQGDGITFLVTGSTITVTSSGGSGGGVTPGVTSLNGLAGALSLSSPDFNISTSAPVITLDLKTTISPTFSGLTINGTASATTFSGSGSSLTSLPAGQLTGTIPSGVLGNSTHYIGTTAITLNRAAANQGLTGITSIAMPGSTSGTVTIQPTAIAGTTTTITFPATTGTVVLSGFIVNADIASGAAIAYSKLSLSNSIVNADISTTAGIVYSKLSLTNSIVNADIATTAAIAYSKLSLSNSIVNADISTTAAIAITKLAASTISGISLGNNLNTLTLATSGTGISGSATYNGSNTATFTVTSNATSANTPSAIVARDASGNFIAGTISASLSGNASTATTLATGRTFSVSGDVTGTTATGFNGSANATIPVTLNTVNLNTGSFGASSTIPVITVNAKGLITAVSTASVVTSQTLSLTGAVTASATALNIGSLSTVFGSGSVNGGTNISVSGLGTSSITISVTGTVASASNANTVTNGVYTTGSYDDPSWITSLSGSKITGNISGSSSNITQYTINQNLGTSNSPSFAGLTVSGVISSGPQGNKTIIVDYVPTSVSASVSVGYGYTVNANSITLTLPNTSLADGDRISFIPGSNLINSYTISGNGNAIMNTDTSMIVDLAVPFDLIWNGTNTRWVLG